MIFLDAAATTPVRREVLEAMWPFLTGEFGNPSSHHSLGDAAARALAEARKSVAKVLGCRPAEVTFTSGGTEADNLAVKGIALARQAADPALNRVVISAVEHPAVEESARYLERFHGFTVDVAPVDSYGTVTAEALAAVLRPETALVSIMYANNEVGTVQPVAALAALARERGIPFHTDAVQAAGWLPVDVKTLGVDALSISGHKLGAPKGSGVLFVRGRTKSEPLVHGGGQERGRRSGTENVAGAVGLATALTLAHADQAALSERVTVLRDKLHQRRAWQCSRRRADRPSGRAAAVRGILLLPGHQRGIRAPGAGTPGRGLLQRFGLRGRIRRAVTGAPALGIEAEVAQTAVRFSFDSSVTASGPGDRSRRRDGRRRKCAEPGPSGTPAATVAARAGTATLMSGRGLAVPGAAEDPVPEQREPDRCGEEPGQRGGPGARRPQWRPAGASGVLRGCRR